MKLKRTVLLALTFSATLAAPLGHASGAAGIFAIVEKVVLEPDARAPQRARIYGAFALYDVQRPRAGEGATPSSTTAATRGYLYFTLPVPENEHAAVRREWADLAAVAGTGDAVAFAGYQYLGAFASDESSAGIEVFVAIPEPENAAQARAVSRTNGSVTFYGAAALRVWAEAESAATPIPYDTTEVGVMRLGQGNRDDVVAMLRAALAP